MTACQPVFSATSGSIQIDMASRRTETLDLDLRFDLQGEPLAAMQSNVVLPFAIVCQQGWQTRRIEQIRLSFSPLLQSYELVYVKRNTRQHFRVKVELLKAFEHPRAIALGKLSCERVRVELERAKLPAPLRLPALLQSAWQIDSAWANVQIGND
jgi:Domain of unknown function (DUF4390)